MKTWEGKAALLLYVRTRGNLRADVALSPKESARWLVETPSMRTMKALARSRFWDNRPTWVDKGSPSLCVHKSSGDPKFPSSSFTMVNSSSCQKSPPVAKISCTPLQYFRDSSSRSLMLLLYYKSAERCERDKLMRGG